MRKKSRLEKNGKITYRQPKNLKRIRAGLPSKGEGESEVDPGCIKFGKNCHACKISTEGKYFSSTNTGKRYSIKQKVLCDLS